MKSINMFRYSRTSTLILLKKTNESIWDIQPDGFPNTIRWNAGHVYSTAEDYLNEADDQYKIIRPDWHSLFLDGTRPTEWPNNIPSKAEISEALEEQEIRIFEHFKDKLKNKASVTRDVNGLMLDNIDASLQFVTWHEGIHLGVVNSLSKIIK